MKKSHVPRYEFLHFPGAAPRRELFGAVVRRNQDAIAAYCQVDVPKHSWEGSMLWTIAVILLILWFLGFVTSYTMGGFIHILLVIAIVMILVRLISGRRAV